MPIRRTQFQKGERYHLYNRGNNSHKICLIEAHFLQFLDSIGKYLVADTVIFELFSILPNHYHFSIKLKEDFDLSAAMRLALGEYAAAFNKQSRRHGHVFEGRFKSKRIDNTQYQDYLNRYIHRNPVEAGLTSDPFSWPFSSIRTYASGDQPLERELSTGKLPTRREGWRIPQIQASETLERFSSREEYKQFVLSDWDREPWHFENGIWKPVRFLSKEGQRS